MNSKISLTAHLLLLLAFLAGFSWSEPAQAAQLAATFTVNSTVDSVDANQGDGVCADASSACTLRAAILEANALPGTDTVNIPAGSYLLTIPGIEEDSGLTGDLDIIDDLIVTGAGQDLTIVDGNGLDVVFHIPSQGLVSISDLTVSGGFGHGAGVHNFGNTTLTDVTVANNTGEFGVVTNHNTLTVINITITGNTATHGAGIHNGYTMNIISSLITGNSAPGSVGAGLLNHGLMTVIDTTISDNSSRIGAGVYNAQHTNIGDHHLTIINSTITGNTATQVGGGIQNSGHMTVINTTVSGNTGDTGGGISNLGEMLTIHNSTITDNIATSSAGGLEVVSGTVMLQNSLLAGNLLGGSASDCTGALLSDGYNLIGNGDNCGFVPSTGDQVGTALNPIDPLLSLLQDNGGPTSTHALLTGSPAIDAGNPAGCTDDLGNLLTTDQRGFIRPVDGDGDAAAVCDIGSFELETGTLEGTITNAFSGSPISGASVTAGGVTVLSAADGFYHIPDLPAGAYDVTAAAAGYTPATVTGVVVPAGGTVNQDLALWPECLSNCLRSTSISLKVTLMGIRSQVAVKNENGLVVSGAAVSVTWTLPDGSTINQMRSTTLAGVASFKVADVGSGTYTLTLTNITKTGYTFDLANSVLSASVIK